MDREGDVIENNLRLQTEEIEILQSMYDKDFQIEDETPTFSIMVHVGEKEGEEATLVVSYNLDYPAHSPPIYHLSVPWLGEEQRRRICAGLEEIYLSHLGEPVVYFWVEKLKEMLFEMKPEKLEPVPSKILKDNLQATTSEDDEETAAELQCEQFVESETGKSRVPGKSSNFSSSPPPQIATGETLTDRKSTFQAHVARVTSVEDVKAVLLELYKIKKIATATHNMYAYRIFKEKQPNICVQDCEDDGETHAGSRLLHLLQILDCRNLVVVVSRWYGGIHLHGDRFKHINNVARTLLEKEGFIPGKSSTRQAQEHK